MTGVCGQGRAGDLRYRGELRCDHVDCFDDYVLIMLVSCGFFFFLLDYM